MEIKPQDIRTGNLYEYYMEDEKKWEPTRLDWQDIQWCDTDNSYFNKLHRPIQIDESWLKRFEFKLYQDETWRKGVLRLVGSGKYYLETSLSFNQSAIEYVHQLQNLYHAITGTEIEELSALAKI